MLEHSWKENRAEEMTQIAAQRDTGVENTGN